MERYEKAQVEIILFDCGDIITSSNGEGDNDTGFDLDDANASNTNTSKI